MIAEDHRHQHHRAIIVEGVEGRHLHHTIMVIGSMHHLKDMETSVTVQEATVTATGREIGIAIGTEIEIEIEIAAIAVVKWIEVEIAMVEENVPETVRTEEAGIEEIFQEMQVTNPTRRFYVLSEAAIKIGNRQKK